MVALPPQGAAPAGRRASTARRALVLLLAVAAVAFLVLVGLAARSRSLPDEPTSALPADVVVVLDGGRVVQRGAPADLLRDDGPFARLVLPVVPRELETP